MIFYGSRASTIKEGKINNVTCPGCENSTTMNYAIFGKYAYIYWIPLFPIGKEKILECNHCKRTYKLKELPEQIKHKFEVEKTGAGYPIWYFSGLAIIAGIIGWASYANAQDDALDIEYINDPQIGDVYSTEGSEEGYYSTLRVNEVSADSIHFIQNDYQTDLKSDIKNIDIDKNYTDQEYSVSKEELKNLLESEFIFEVDRD